MLKGYNVIIGHQDDVSKFSCVEYHDITLVIFAFHAWKTKANMFPIRLPCSMNFLLEFYFADWRFFVFCGNNFFFVRDY